MGIRNIQMAADLAREWLWSGGKDNSAYERGPDLRYGDWLQGLNSSGAAVNLATVNSSGVPQLAPLTELGTPTLNGVNVITAHHFKAVLYGTAPATAGNYGVFEAVPFACVIQSVTAFHQTAGSNGSAVTLDIEKLTGTTAAGSGVTVLGATLIDLKAAANTAQSPGLSAVTADITLAAGDRLALKLTGTPTAVAGLVVMVLVQPA